MDVLQRDVSGPPGAWISAKGAAIAHPGNRLAAALGRAFHALRGGIQRPMGADLA